MLGTTWSASKQAGRQATWQAAAGTEVQKGVALSRMRDERKRERERETRKGDGRGTALAVCMVLGLAVAAMRVVSE